MSSNSTLDRFIEKARLVHGFRYDYSRCGERDSKGRSVIICGIHGEFWQLRSNHLAGSGCKECAIQERKVTVEQFVERSVASHGFLYDYSRIKKLSGTRSKVEIICPVHGDFHQIARDHMRGSGCSSCFNDNSRVSFEDFVSRARKVHGNLYSYVESSWSKDSPFVTVICSKHGPYNQNWYNHSIGMGCRRCRRQVSRSEVEIFSPARVRSPGDSASRGIRTLEQMETANLLVLTGTAKAKEKQTPTVEQVPMVIQDQKDPPMVLTTQRTLMEVLTKHQATSAVLQWVSLFLSSLRLELHILSQGNVAERTRKQMSN